MGQIEVVLQGWFLVGLGSVMENVLVGDVDVVGQVQWGGVGVWCSWCGFLCLGWSDYGDGQQCVGSGQGGEIGQLCIVQLMLVQWCYVLLGGILDVLLGVVIYDVGGFVG